MDKRELENRLRRGEKLEEIIPHFWSGQGYIFKSEFNQSVPLEIIYISEDAYSTASYMERLKSINEDAVDPEEIECDISDILHSCYSTSDFLELAEEYAANSNSAVCVEDIARQLFAYVDWQSPSAALPELDID